MTVSIAQQCLGGIWDAAMSPQARIGLLWLLFYKRISDLREEEPETRGFADPDDPGAGLRRLAIPVGCSWAEVRRRPGELGARLTAAFRAIEDANPSLAGVLSGPDFKDREAFPDSVLQALFSRFERLSLRGTDMDDDAFSSLCDEMAEKTASDPRAFPAGPATPRQVAGLLVEILQPREGMSIYDGACGTGATLRECSRYMKRLKKNAASLHFYGQEIDPDAWALCRIAMLSAGIETAAIERGDSLRNPRHLTGDGRALMCFDRVLCHPPFNLGDWGFDEWQGDAYGRTDYGMPPRSCADLAFLEHSIASLNAKGMLGAVAPQGILFRAREEGEIRRRIIQDDLVEAVINLAPAALSPSLAPACLLILNRAKPKQRRQKVLFVDPIEQSALSESSAKRIASACHAFQDQQGVCQVVPLEEIERNGFTLDVSRYVRHCWEEPRSDVTAEWQNLLRLIAERNEAERKMAEHMSRLARGPHDP